MAVVRIVAVLACTLALVDWTAASVAAARDCQVRFLERFAAAEEGPIRCDLCRLYRQCLDNNLVGVSSATQEQFENTLNYIHATIQNCDLSLPVTTPATLEPLPAEFKRDSVFQRLRRDTISMAELTQTVEEITSQLEDAASQEDAAALDRALEDLGTATDLDSLIATRLGSHTDLAQSLVNAYLDAATARLSNLEANLNSLASPSDLESAKKEIVEAIDAGADGVRSKADKLTSQVESGAEEIRSNYIDLRNRINSFREGMTQRIERLRSLTTSRLDAIEDLLDQATNDVTEQAAIESKLDAEYKALTDEMKAEVASMVSKASTKQPTLLSAFCSRHGTVDGWLPYCLDQQEYAVENTLDFLEIIDPDRGQVRVKKAGMYRINFFAISLSGSWAYTQFVHNGIHRHHGHEHSHGTWTDNFIDITWPMEVGDVFYINMYKTGGSYNYHHGSWWGTYSRLQVSFEGV